MIQAWGEQCAKTEKNSIIYMSDYTIKLKANINFF